jgi:hypothetical protein
MENATDLKVLPTDYFEYGGQVERWKDKTRDYPDCSFGCKHFVKNSENRDSLGNNWGTCANPKSPRNGLLTLDHMAGYGCFEK